MNDKEGKLIKSDSPFENLCNFWSCFHMSYKTLFIWYHPKMAQLEKAIRRKWVTTKDLPLVNIVLKKFKEKDNYFNPMRYLEGDEEKYFKISQQWKIFFFCYRLNFFQIRLYKKMFKLPLSKQKFEHLDISNLLINIWSYNDQSHRNCSVCKQYE